MSVGNWLVRKSRGYAHTIEALGAWPAVDFTVKGFLDRRHRVDRPFRLWSKRARFPVWCRPGTSDFFVFGQVFVDREYSCLDKVVDPKFIIDCGANVGYTSAYFLSKFPAARLVAVEPDPENARWLRRNLEPYGDRATIVESGLWSHPVGLVVDSTSGDGLAWARQVRECRPGEPAQMTATDIQTILDQSGFTSISILKLDVEGSEKVIFASNYAGWLDRVENIAIELHGEECEKVFHKAIGDESFQLSRSGELTVCLRGPRADRKPEGGDLASNAAMGSGADAVER